MSCSTRLPKGWRFGWVYRHPKEARRDPQNRAIVNIEHRRGWYISEEIPIFFGSFRHGAPPSEQGWPLESRVYELDTKLFEVLYNG